MRESRSQKLETTGKRLETVQKQATDLRRALATYRRLEATGFDEKALGELAKATEKYGEPRKVLAAQNNVFAFSSQLCRVFY